MKQIVLSKGEIALVDDSDYVLLSKHKWYLSNGYAINETRQKMHRIIMCAKPGELVDHKDHNKLNNQRSNLRIVGLHENVHNQYKRANTKNNYKGVHFIEKLGLWQSRCRIYENDFYLGLYKSEIAAAYAYNKKAKELSECALLNVIDYPDAELEELLIADRATIEPAAKQSGIKGVYWNCTKDAWEVKLKGKRLGTFKDISTAKVIVLLQSKLNQHAFNF